MRGPLTTSTRAVIEVNRRMMTEQSTAMLPTPPLLIRRIAGKTASGTKRTRMHSLTEAVGATAAVLATAVSIKILIGADVTAPRRQRVIVMTASPLGVESIEAAENTRHVMTTTNSPVAETKNTQNGRAPSRQMTPSGPVDTAVAIETLTGIETRTNIGTRSEATGRHIATETMIRRDAETETGTVIAIVSATRIKIVMATAIAIVIAETARTGTETVTETVTGTIVMEAAAESSLPTGAPRQRTRPPNLATIAIRPQPRTRTLWSAKPVTANACSRRRSAWQACRA